MADTTQDDLKAASEAGLITAVQAQQLSGFLESRDSAKGLIDPDDEPFLLFQGLNEIFISAGIVMLGIGMFTLSGFLVFAADPSQSSVWSLFILGFSYALSFSIAWFLSVYFILQRRLVLPSITLSTLITLGTVLTAGIATGFLDVDKYFPVLILSAGFIAAAAFYARFRLPYALLPLSVTGGGSLVALVVLLFGKGDFGNSFEFADIFDLTQSTSGGVATLIVGLLVFLIAVRFDLSDPHRVSRRSANAFWMHVAAAPAMMNVAGVTLLTIGNFWAGLLLLLVIAAAALVAIILDRRSFLLAGSAYLLALSFSTMESANSAIPYFMTLIIVGSAVISLGAFWPQVRARVITALPDHDFKQKLPPYERAR